MNVNLTPELEQLVHAKVQSGRYSSASEVVREALRQMEHSDEMRAAHLQELRAHMDRAVADADRGDGVAGETFLQGLIDDLDRRGAKRNAGWEA